MISQAHFELPINTITVWTYIITKLAVRHVGLAAIVVIMYVSTFKAAVILCKLQSILFIQYNKIKQIQG